MNLALGLSNLLTKDYKLFEYPVGKFGYSTFYISPNAMINEFGV